MYTSAQDERRCMFRKHIFVFMISLRQSMPEYHVLDGDHYFTDLNGGKGLHLTKLPKCTWPTQWNISLILLFVFDGYKTSGSTKHVTHMRRSKGAVGPTVLFTGSMTLKSKKEHFLRNTENKQTFIDFLCEQLQASGVRTLNADGDADLLIALTGVECAKRGVTHVYWGKILTCLFYSATTHDRGMHELIFRSDKRKNRNVQKV